jgi:hypothetical protein
MRNTVYGEGLQYVLAEVRQGSTMMDVLIGNLCRTLLLFWRRRWIRIIRNSRLWSGRLLLLSSRFIEHGVEDGELGSDARRGALQGV